MRIGVNTLFLIPGEVGGSETYLRETLHAIATGFEGIELVLFTNRENDGYFRALFSNIGHVEYCKLNFRAINRVARILREQLELPSKARQTHIDLLWSGGYTAPLFCSCPQVVTIYDMQYKSYPEDLTFLARLATDVLVGAAARRCDGIISISEFSRQEILKHTSALPGRVCVTHAGVHIEFSEDLSAQEIREIVTRLIRSDLPYLLCVANTYAHKNVHLLVDSFGAILNDIPHLLVLAGFPGLGEKHVVRAIERLPQPDRVVRLDHLSRSDLRALYQGADLFVFPSLYEGFGLPVLEAMMSGVPVVAAHRGAIPEVAGDCVCYFDETKDGNLARKISEMLGMWGDRRKAWIKKARERAAGFTWQRTAEKTVECFRDVVRVGRGRDAP